MQGHFIDAPPAQGTCNSKGPEVFIKDVFMDSDTDVMVLSFVPSAREAEPVTIQAADAVRRTVEKLEGRTGSCCTAASIRTSRATSRGWTS